MKTPSLRAKLTAFYAIVVSVLLTGFALLYYRVLSVDLNQALTQELVETAAALRGYLRFDSGKPVLVYDDADPEQAAFIRTAARYFQVYDAATGELLAQSPELDVLGVQYSSSDVGQLVDEERTFVDLETDQGKLRFRTETITDSSGRTYLLMTGASTEPIDDAVATFLRSLVWLIPSGVALAAIASWFMAGRAWRPIEHSIEQMKQFTASISHELRTPLAVLRGEAEIALMREQTPEHYRRVLASQLEEFEKLGRMVNQLLTLARAESGDVPILRELVDVSAMARTLAEQLEPVAASKGVKLALECEQDVKVMGDPGWIERIVLNLVDNAIKFTPSGGTVRMRVSRDARNASLQVQDTGIGIAAEALPQVFDRFYRADTSRSGDTAGAGLGLTLVKWAVDQHHGWIEINSSPENGTCVSVQLPAQH